MALIISLWRVLFIVHRFKSRSAHLLLLRGCVGLWVALACRCVLACRHSDHFAVEIAVNLGVSDEAFRHPRGVMAHAFVSRPGFRH